MKSAKRELRGSRCCWISAPTRGGSATPLTCSRGSRIRDAPGSHPGGRRPPPDRTRDSQAPPTRTAPRFLPGAVSIQASSMHRLDPIDLVGYDPVRLMAKEALSWLPVGG